VGLRVSGHTRFAAETWGNTIKTCVAMVLLLFCAPCLAQAYPEPEAAAAWRGLAASYVRKALRDQTLARDPALNARVDKVIAAVGAAVAATDSRFARASWKAILIEDFGHGAVAFPGETVLVDAKFVRALQLNDDELALIFSHEAAHVIAGHASAKLSFMAEFLGKEKVPTARTALLEFLAKDSYAAVFQPVARLQEREADALGAAIFHATGFDSQRALGLFDKLTELETRDSGGWAGRAADTHDSAEARKQAVSKVIAEL
jgi:predicted Zn-dependent protease